MTSPTTRSDAVAPGGDPEHDCEDGCGDAATTAREGRRLCADCAALFDWFAEQHPIAMMWVTSPAGEMVAP